MKRRLILLRDWTELQGGVQAELAQLALETARQAGGGLRVCVHDLMNCEQLLENAFPSALARKLRRRESVNDSGVMVVLETLKTLKKSYPLPPAVYLVLFPSPGLLVEVERTPDGSSVIVLSETDNAEHVVAWQRRHSPREILIRG